MLKKKGIKLLAKPLGRPSALYIHVSPGERNPIEGKFGQAKTGYGLNRIKARLKNTSEAWIAGIFLVLNLVKLAGVARPCLILMWMMSFSAWVRKKQQHIRIYIQHEVDLRIHHSHQLQLLSFSADPKYKSQASFTTNNPKLPPVTFFSDETIASKF